MLSYERHLRRLRSQLRLQREQSAQAIARYFPRGTRLSLPRGGLSLWLELPAGCDSSLLYDQALAQGIRIAPGAMFSNSGRYGQFMRLSCGLPFTPEVEQAYCELGRLLWRVNWLVEWALTGSAHATGSTVGTLKAKARQMPSDDLPRDGLVA